MASKTVLSLVLTILHFSVFRTRLAAGQDGVRAGYWFPDSGIAASDIDSSLFTHLFCAFANIDSNTSSVVVSPSTVTAFLQFTQTVRARNPSVQTLLSIGGGGSNWAAYAFMASQQSSRRSFIDSSISLARSYGFSGLDLDWEYPGDTTQMTNFGSLLAEWRAATVTEASNSGLPRLILTAAVYYASSVNGLDYPIQSVSTSLDWLNLMAYDFYGPTSDWAPTMTHGPAVLFDRSSQISGSFGIQSWIEAGVDTGNLVLGLPFYGYSWRLVNANNNGLLAPANGTGSTGDGSMPYRQIRAFISRNRTTTVYNSTFVTNYCYSGTTWIGYDDTQSISAKVSYARQNGLVGFFAWHVAADNNWALTKQANQAWENVSFGRTDTADEWPNSSHV